MVDSHNPSIGCRSCPGDPEAGAHAAWALKQRIFCEYASPAIVSHAGKISPDGLHGIP